MYSFICSFIQEKYLLGSREEAELGGATGTSWGPENTWVLTEVWLEGGHLCKRTQLHTEDTSMMPYVKHTCTIGPYILGVYL